MSYQQIYKDVGFSLVWKLFGFSFLVTLCLPTLKSNRLFSTQVSSFLLRSKSFQALKIKGQAVSQLRTFHDVLSGQEVNVQSLTCPEGFIQERGSRSRSSKP